MMLLLLAAGGAAGTLARFALSGWFLERGATGFPWGTFAVNAVGSLLIGFTMQCLDAVPVTAETRAFLTIGLLGGFTTFSSYTWESVALFRAGRLSAAIGYTAGSVAVGLCAVVAGLALATLALRTAGT